MLDKIKGLKKYTDCSMPTNNNELRQKESVSGYNQAIEDVVKIFSIYDVSQRSELLKKWWKYFDEESVAVNCNEQERKEVINNFFNCG
jgi:hypothetical protein